MHRLWSFSERKLDKFANLRFLKALKQGCNFWAKRNKKDGKFLDLLANMYSSLVEDQSEKSADLGSILQYTLVAKRMTYHMFKV